MAPTVEQINRACRLYSSGADAETFRERFASEADEECMWLLWHAAKTAHAIDERHPFTSHRKYTTSNGTQVIVR